MTAPIEPREMAPERMQLFAHLLELAKERVDTTDGHDGLALEHMGARELLGHIEWLRRQEVSLHAELVTERAAHAETLARNDANQKRVWELLAEQAQIEADRDLAREAANHNLSCTAKAVAELEEAKGLLRETLLPPTTERGRAWLKRRDALLTRAGAKTEACRDCGGLGYYATGDTNNPTQTQCERCHTVDERTKQCECGATCMDLRDGCRYVLADERAGGDPECNGKGHCGAWACEDGRCKHPGGERPTLTRTQIDAATRQGAIDRVGCVTCYESGRNICTCTAPPVAKQAEGRPSDAERQQVVDTLVSNFSSLAEPVRKLLAYTKRLETDIADYRQGIEPDGTGRHASFVVYKNKMRAAVERAEAAEAARAVILDDCATARDRAEAAERNWREAKIEFGDNMAKQRERIAQLEAERDSGGTLALVERFFGDTHKALLWMVTSNPLLGNVSPQWMLQLGRGDKLHHFVVTSLAENRQPLSAAAVEGT